MRKLWLGIFVLVIVVWGIFLSTDKKDWPQIITPPEENTREWFLENTFFQWKYASGSDSPASGFVQLGVYVKEKEVVDVMAFGWDEEAYSACVDQVSKWVVTDECPTNTVLYLERYDGKGFFPQFTYTIYNDIDLESDASTWPKELAIGCFEDGQVRQAPMWWVEQDLSVITSQTSRGYLLTAKELGEPLIVLLKKGWYDIPWRWWTACDIFYTSLEVVG